jgi:ribosome-binding protein aMBF1 (putative translation factor)
MLLRFCRLRLYIASSVDGVKQGGEQLARRLQGFGAGVRQERLRLGLSQEELAGRAGLHRTYIGSVERGERNVAIGNAYALADALGVSLFDLLLR